MNYLELFIFSIFYCLRCLTLLVPILLAVAFLTLLERKVLGAIQIRTGPNVVGFFGLLQPLADGVKLLLKEVTKPSISDPISYSAAPMITFFLATLTLTVLPFSSYEVFIDFQFGLMFIFALSSLGIYGIIFAGWSSNSRYALLGSLRSAAQIISYEVSFGLSAITVCIMAGSVNFTEILEFQLNYGYIIYPLFPSFILFLLASLAETSRPPFDLPEAEAELVSGYNTEYSAVTFALFFIGEYLNVIVSCILVTVLFFGGESFFGIGNGFIFSLKVVFFLFAFISIRAALPRLRYDQLMQLGWKSLLPLAFGWFTFVFCTIFFATVV